MDEMLLLLLRHGAHLAPVKLTSSELGAQLSMSQQNASRRLLELERGGYVERKDSGLMLTRKGREELAGLYSVLKAALEGGRLELEGTVATGLGEGRFYLSLPGYRRQIEEKLGFRPYPGTLNLRLDEADLWKRRHLLALDAVVIRGFRDRKRSYGDLFAYPCTARREKCAVLVPLRTHHGAEIIEVISARNLKRALRKKDGDRVKVVV